MADQDAIQIQSGMETLYRFVMTLQGNGGLMENYTPERHDNGVILTPNNENHHLNPDESLTNITSVSNMSGVSDLTSTMDDDGNIIINAKYNSDTYKCCVCYECIVGPIISCNNNHSLCKNCFTEISKMSEKRCPICRSIAKGRNYILENALLSIIKPCQYSNQGCDHQLYPENIKEHSESCKYADIKCLWCDSNTTTFDLHTHAESVCTNIFSEMSCSDRLDFIKSDKIDKMFIISSMEQSRILFVYKTENDCNLICIQSELSEINNMTSICMEYKVDMESRRIEIPIHTPEHLIKKEINTTIIPLDALKDYNNITITGFKEKYMVGSRWAIKDSNNEWHNVIITKRKYNPDRIMVKFNEYPSDRFDKWIELDAEMDNIQPIRINVDAYEDEVDDEQMRLVMERSINET